MDQLRCTIGVDVGGTNTDCVIMQGSELIGSAKRPTTENVTSGVESALAAALQDACRRGGETPTDFASRVDQVNIGTTHFVNAVVQRRSLARVAAFRLCGQSTRGVPPFAGFPRDLVDKVCHSTHLLDGGYTFDGRELVKVYNRQVFQYMAKLQYDFPQCEHVAITGLFSPLYPEQEKYVAELFTEHFPSASVTLSHQVGHTGLLERENATILNESLKPLANKTLAAFRQALTSLGLHCPLYLTQNDGTIISEDRARQFPVLTFASGPTNSMRGAAFLSNVADAIVIDIGGTTTDVGMIQNGFPREASSEVKIGGLSTNYRMPDVLSIGLGGGSLVDAETIKVGPVSVGYMLTQEARVFGGETLTTTDIAVAAGLADIGTVRPATSLPSNKIAAVVQRIHEMVEEAADRIKVTSQSLPVLLVGGGSVLIDSSKPFAGALSVSKPPHYDVANAVGAALSQVSGSVDYVVSLDKTPRDVALKEAEQRAKDSAIEAGAVAESVKIVEVVDIPLTYIPGNAIRLKVKAVGDLSRTPFPGTTAQPADVDVDEPFDVPADEPAETTPQEDTAVMKPPSTTSNVTHSGDEDIEMSAEKSRQIDATTGDWIVSKYDVECIAVGAGILGCGGGGSPSIGRLRALRVLQQGKQIRIVSPERLGMSPDLMGLVAPVAFMGAPTIITEKLVSDEVRQGLFVVQQLINAGFGGGMPTHPPPHGYEQYITNPVPGVHRPTSLNDLKNRTVSPDRHLCAVVSCEVGGLNAMEPLVVGGLSDLPIVDADGMGRAFPELQMYSPAIYGGQLCPSCLSDDWGHSVFLTHVNEAKQMEDYFRTETIKMGCSAGIVFGPQTAAAVQEKMIKGSLSRAWQLGHAVLEAQRNKVKPVDAILSREIGKPIITGKIVDVSRTTESGFSRGFVLIEGFGDYSGLTIKIDLQNEFLIARPQLTPTPDPTYGPAVATVPDLIVMIDTDTGFPITTEDARYGLRVTALVLASQHIMRTPRALEVVGPKAFGYPDVEYHPVEEELANQ